MSQPIVEVKSVSKCYRLGSIGATSLKDELDRLWNRLRGTDHAVDKSDFWALKDVSFEVQTGEILGIIGRNGAGKSTLLKIMSRITEPTSGEITLRGRVASLLEVGTGFHPDLSGRENIFLNGAILGMMKSEIRRKLDEIVAFAEVEQFLDTPVKRYSSGMFVRLAFAVAAHLDPEILVVDEVLAVGDVRFQEKCIGKMKEVAKGAGRTVLFVSHNMGTIAQLCRKAALLEKGRLVAYDEVGKVLGRYFASGSERPRHARFKQDSAALRARKKLFFTHVTLEAGEHRETADIDVHDDFRIQIGFEVPKPLRNVELSFRVVAADGRSVFTSLMSDMSPDALRREFCGQHEYAVTVPGMFLMPGSYSINIAAHEPVGELFDLHEGILPFRVHDTGTNFARYQDYGSIGLVIKNLFWEEVPEGVRRAAAEAPAA